MLDLLTRALYVFTGTFEVRFETDKITMIRLVSFFNGVTGYI